MLICDISRTSHCALRLHLMAHFTSFSKNTTFEVHPSITKSTPNHAFAFILHAPLPSNVPQTCTWVVPHDPFYCATSLKMAAKSSVCSCKKADTITLLRWIQQGALPEGIEESRIDVSPLTGCVYCIGSHGDGPLLVAARCGHLDVVKTLCERYGCPLEVSNDDGKRPLHEAAQNGHTECARYLLYRGAHVDALKKADWWVVACGSH